MELRPGYKQTEIGSIPEDWGCVAVRDAAASKPNAIVGGPFGSDLVSADYTTTGVPVIRGQNMRAGAVAGDFAFVSEQKAKSLSANLAHPDDLVFTQRGTLGQVSAVPDGYYPCYLISQSQMKLSLDIRKHDPQFVRQYFASLAGQKQILDSAIQTGVPHTNLGILRSYRFPAPPLPEQSAIATALGDVDDLLTAQDALIEKKRAIKQGAMQELLTGNLRLPGFEGDWKVVRLRDHSTFLKNGTNSRAELTQEGGIKYLHYGDIHDASEALWDVASRNLPYLALAKASRLARLEDGDLVFADASEDLLGVAKSIEIVGANNQHVVPGLHTIAVRFDKSVLADGFKAYLQFMPSFRSHLLRLVAGTKVYSTNRAHFSSCEIALPDVQEQKAIARVLSDMEAAIATLEAKREKTALLRRGMMQELLTGKTRLVVPAAQYAEVSANVIPFKKERTDPQVAPTAKESRGVKANVHFRRSVFAAEIVDQLHNEPTFGHVKFEKLIFLAEHLCRVDTGSNYHRDAAGPYDNRALRSIDSQLKEQKWFDPQKSGGRYQYVPLGKHGGHKEYFDRYYADIRTRLDEIVATFRTAKTDQCEIVATLYGAWADLINQGELVTDEAILDQVLNHWHDKKREISVERWRKALEWMREKDYVPAGASRA